MEKKVDLKLIVAAVGVIVSVLFFVLNLLSFSLLNEQVELNKELVVIAKEDVELKKRPIIGGHKVYFRESREELLRLEMEVENYGNVPGVIRSYSLDVFIGEEKHPMSQPGEKRVVLFPGQLIYLSPGGWDNEEALNALKKEEGDFIYEVIINFTDVDEVYSATYRGKFRYSFEMDKWYPVESGIT